MSDFNKKLIFRINDKVHADLKIAVDYEEINQSDFLRLMIDKFLEEDARILEILKEWRVENEKSIKRSEKIREKELAEKEKELNKFGIHPTDYENIYDMFEEEDTHD